MSDAERIAALERQVHALMEELIWLVDGSDGRRRMSGGPYKIRVAIPEVVRGLLGWSNKRTGLEFYRWDEKTIPRHGTEWGDLLISELGPDGGREYEGCPVVVVVLDRRATGDDLAAVEAACREATA